MKLARFSLYFAAVAFLTYGAVFLIFPSALSILVGANLSTPSAAIDVRATYGGAVAGTGLLFWLCGRRSPWMRVGLVAQAVILGGFIVGRVLGLILEGNAVLFIYVLLTGEGAGLALALAALRAHARDSLDTPNA